MSGIAASASPRPLQQWHGRERPAGDGGGSRDSSGRGLGGVTPAGGESTALVIAPVVGGWVCWEEWEVELCNVKKLCALSFCLFHVVYNASCFVFFHQYLSNSEEKKIFELSEKKSN